ncbi:MAG: hypothetical protein HC843_01805 [Sphingomonadales bacterium]|nr:hypothetical protein [Sphingomonadales bacterium]
MIAFSFTHLFMMTAVVALLVVTGSWFALKLNGPAEKALGGLDRATRKMVFGLIAAVNIMGVIACGAIAAMF